MAREKKEEIVEPVETEPIKLDAAKEIIKEMKQDPTLRKFMVPIPDYGMVSCILAYRILKKLEGK